MAADSPGVRIRLPGPEGADDVGVRRRSAVVAAVVALAVAAVAATRHLPVVAAIAVTAPVAVVAAAAVLRTRRLAALLATSEVEASLDPLTGLLNRPALLHDLERRLAGRRPKEIVGALAVDVDRIELINDTMGHAAGDEVLRAVAHRLLEAVRDGDAVGRFGGDEFVVVTSGLRSVVDLERLARRILERLEAPVTLADGSRQVATASIGIAYALKGEPTADDLLRDADVATYRAKEAGGSGAVVFDDALRARAAARREVERELRRAVRDGQLVVQYQPIVDAATGTVHVVEALVRWRHPTRGLIPPDQFLSVASESGLIIEVGRHVLDEACAQAAHWSEVCARPITVAVNLADRQLVDHALLDTVDAALAASGLPAGQLELEVAEELVADPVDRRLGVLRQLASRGVRLALDDFGTTRASLRQLKALDMVSTLKIDRSFVAELEHDDVDRKVVTAVVALAESLGMAVVAEGVETAEQAAVLIGLGVDRLQGFWLQRPDGADAITPSLQRPVALPGPYAR